MNCVMPRQNRQSSFQNAISAAVRRFPQFELTIRRLMDRNDSFREICEGLAEAELTLSRVDLVPAGLREARQAEWQELVDRLVGEIRAAVREAEANQRSGINHGPLR